MTDHFCQGLCSMTVHITHHLLLPHLFTLLPGVPRRLFLSLAKMKVFCKQSDFFVPLSFKSLLD